MKTIEGTIRHSGLETYFKLATTEGDPPPPEEVTPLVVLHGGPGCTHDYLLSLTDLVTPSRPVLFYDQVGNGGSTHRPDAPPDFWNVELFLAELDAVLTHLNFSSRYHLLGQSWGGMLAAEHAVRRPDGLGRLIIANSPASMPLWREAARNLRAALPLEVRDLLDAHEERGTIESASYKQASDVYYDRHVCRIAPLPEDVKATYGWLDADPTVYRAMNGPTEFHVVGSLREWSVIDRLHAIKAPTLVINGRYDEATDPTIAPFISEIPDVRHRRFEQSSHMPHWEERPAYMAEIHRFLLM